MKDEDEVSFIPMEAVGEFGGLDLSATKPLGEIGNGYTFFADGDVVVAKITPCFENGKGALARNLRNGVAFGTTELHVLRGMPDQLLPEYLFYLSVSQPFRSFGEGSMYGAGGQKRVPEDFIRNLRWPIPPAEEQRDIAAFLDRETARIDALLERKRRLIALLQENRAAVINAVVTKGLDKAFPLRDSGIGWLGMIPAHWSLQRFKHVTTRVDVGIAEAATHAYADDGVPLIRSTNVFPNELRTSGLLAVEPWFAKRNRSKTLRRGDLVTVRTGAPGTTAVVPDELDGCQCFTLLMSTVSGQHHSPYFSYYLNSSAAITYFQLVGWGTAQINISVPILKEAPVPVPPPSEQRAIADRCRLYEERFRAAISTTERVIARLTEYRSSLIAAAVTGQIDVREAA